MFVKKLVDSLERFGRMLPIIVNDIGDDDRKWKPPSGNWSIHEIVCHLADEEEFDFPVRTRSTLEKPQQPWPKIDPEGWAIERDYLGLTFEEQLSRFLFERNRSMEWLKSLENSDWNQAYEHPEFGPFRAGDILAAWAAHDWLHLRQISKRLYEIAGRDGQPFSNRYAGDWTA